MNEKDTWEKWRVHVLAEIRRVNDNAKNIHEAVQALNVEIAKLQVKSGVWGLLGGLIPVLILLFSDKLK